MLAVDSFMRLNGKTSIMGLDDFEEEEKPAKKRIAFSTHGWSDLYRSEEEEEKKGSKK